MTATETQVAELRAILQRLYDEEPPRVDDAWLAADGVDRVLALCDEVDEGELSDGVDPPGRLDTDEVRNALLGVER